METQPVCQRCKYFYVTHESNMPYGCRAMRFKSTYNPAQVVLSSSGMECQMFAIKNSAQDRETVPTAPLKWSS